jgi:hypothetical protein
LRAVAEFDETLEPKSNQGANGSLEKASHGRGKQMKFTKFIAVGLSCAALAACGGNNAEENVTTDANLTTDMNMTDMNMTDMNMTDLNTMSDLNATTDANMTDANMTDMNSTNTL